MSIQTPSKKEPDCKSSLVISKLRRTREEYMCDRVQYKINQYAKKGCQYRWYYSVLMGIATSGAVLVPALINWEDVPKQVPTSIGMAVAVSIALEGVFHTREQWRNYDLISSSLREEEMRFSTGAEPYSRENPELDDDKIFQKFVDRIEDAIAKERVETIEQRTTLPSSNK
jgi:hypothetical protein